MKLTEFNNKPHLTAKKALKENFNTSINYGNLTLADTKNMLRKVKGLIKETKETNAIHTSEQNPAYLKLVFMEQALSHHYGQLKAMPVYNSRIVVENEEVDQAQVVLAVKDMVDRVQKMVEQISDMLVKELPAVVDSVNSEIGTNEGEQFNTQVTEALTSLSAALGETRTSLQGALGIVTGQSTATDFGGEEELGGELGDEMGGELGDEMGGEEEIPALPEEPEEIPAPRLGREKR